MIQTLISPVFLALASLAQSPAETFGVDQVLIISIDGLRSDALPAAGEAALPNLHALLRAAGTLNARCDPSQSVTLPNHAGMLTGRLTSGVEGHGWTGNVDPPAEATLHDRGAYVAGVFDVAHDHGLRTALIAAKTKFVLFDRSWGPQSGAMDAVGADHGHDKLDVYQHAPNARRVADAALVHLRQGGRSLAMVHFSDPDLAGHADGWKLTRGSVYLEAVAHVDGQIGRILAAVREDPELHGKVALIVTTDHGGGAPHRSHERPDMWVDYVIPFLVWLGDAAPGGELYDLNQGTRSDPGIRKHAPGSAALPPVRNADAGNLALALLGLPAIPGSTVNAAQDLRVAAPVVVFPAPTGASR